MAGVFSEVAVSNLVQAGDRHHQCNAYRPDIGAFPVERGNEAFRQPEDRVQERGRFSVSRPELAGLALSDRNGQQRRGDDEALRQPGVPSPLREAVGYRQRLKRQEERLTR